MHEFTLVFLSVCLQASYAHLLPCTKRTSGQLLYTQFLEEEVEELNDCFTLMIEELPASRKNLILLLIKKAFFSSCCKNDFSRYNSLRIEN